MIDNFNILIDDSFVAGSIAAKFEAGTNVLSGVSAVLSELGDAINEDDDLSAITVEQFDALAAKYGVNLDTDLVLGDAVIKLRDVRTSLVSDFNSYADGAKELEDISIAYTNISGQLSSLSLDSFISRIKEQIVAGNCVSGLATAFTGTSSVSDRIGKFQIYIDQTLPNANSNYGSVIQYYKQLVANSNCARDGINSLLTSMGAFSLTDNDSDDYEEVNSDLYKYTGCTPLGAYSASGVATAAANTGKMLLKALAGVVVAGFGLLAKGYNYVANKVTTTFVNSYDVKEVNVIDGAPSVAGYQFQYSSPRGATIPIGDFPGMTPELAQRIADEDILFETNKWYKCILRYGELAVRITNINYDSSRSEINLNYQAVFKPYTYNFRLHPAYRSTSNVSLTNIINAAKIDGPDMFLDTRASEVDLCRSLSCATYLTQETMRMMYLAVKATYNPSASYTLEMSGFGGGDFVSDETVITNRDFIKAASGWSDTIPQPIPQWVNYQRSYYIAQLDQWNTGEFQFMGAEYFLRALAYARICQKYNPSGVPLDKLAEVYVPYAKDTQSIRESKFLIKTDTENQAIAQALIDVLLVVLVVAAAVAVGTAVAKTVSRSLFFKRQAFVSQLNAKMARGEKLTSKEQRKYVKFSRKLKLSNLLNAGENKSSEQNSNDATEQLDSTGFTTVMGEDSIDLSQISRLIK